MQSLQRLVTVRFLITLFEIGWHSIIPGNTSHRLQIEIDGHFGSMTYLRY